MGDGFTSWCHWLCSSVAFDLMSLRVVPIRWQDAVDFIAELHRHHKPPQGWLFGIGAARGEELAGVVTVGRPVARHLDDGMTCEVTRCCTDGTKNACSMLYAAAWRACKAMGYSRLITYTLDTEPGTSLEAAGWKCLGKRGGGNWNCPSRPRKDSEQQGQKMLWEATS